MQWDLLLGARYGKGRARREGPNAAPWCAGEGTGSALCCWGRCHSPWTRAGDAAGGVLSCVINVGCAKIQGLKSPEGCRMGSGREEAENWGMQLAA